MILLEARCLIWTYIIEEIQQHWNYLTLMDDKKIVVLLFGVQLQEGHTDGEAKAAMAKKYIQYLDELGPEELLAQGINDPFKRVLEVRRVIEKETARAYTLGCLKLFSRGVEQFE